MFAIVSHSKLFELELVYVPNCVCECGIGVNHGDGSDGSRLELVQHLLCVCVRHVKRIKEEKKRKKKFMTWVRVNRSGEQTQDVRRGGKRIFFGLEKDKNILLLLKKFSASSDHIYSVQMNRENDEMMSNMMRVHKAEHTLISDQNCSVKKG